MTLKNSSHYKVAIIFQRKIIATLLSKIIIN